MIKYVLGFMLLLSQSVSADLPSQPTIYDELLGTTNVGEGIKTVSDFNGNMFPSKNGIFQDANNPDEVLIKGNKLYRASPTDDDPSGICVYTWYIGTDCIIGDGVAQCSTVEIYN